jgi:hypothetical protein
VALTRTAIETMAPDQGALAAASALLKPAKWPLRATSGNLIWGECQGSGANPYRVMADVEDPGSKCTCPSRKFPCKHALALMWMYVEDRAAFRTADVPEWVTEWMSRRRKGAALAAARVPAEGKSLDAARVAEAPKPADPAAEARRIAAAEKRAAETRRGVRAATEDLELWISDQLRAGLPGFLGEASEHCRRIAARLVDAKAGALASRIDEMPSRLLELPAEERADAAIAELGKLVLLARAWRAAPEDPELRREVIGSETREEVLNDPASPRVDSIWEVLGERIATRRDGLVSVATWLLNLGDGPQRFALLLDFFPASAGRRSGAFVPGERFQAELAYYRGRHPYRAVIAARSSAAAEAGAWPVVPACEPLGAFADRMLEAPWLIEAPLLLPAGRVAQDSGGRNWWRAETDGVALPITGAPPPVAFGARIETAAGIWNGARLALIAGRSDWGRIGFDA